MFNRDYRGAPDLAQCFAFLLLFGRLRPTLRRADDGLKGRRYRFRRRGR